MLFPLLLTFCQAGGPRRHVTIVLEPCFPLYFSLLSPIAFLAGEKAGEEKPKSSIRTLASSSLQNLIISLFLNASFALARFLSMGGIGPDCIGLDRSIPISSGEPGVYPRPLPISFLSS